VPFVKTVHQGQKEGAWQRQVKRRIRLRKERHLAAAWGRGSFGGDLCADGKKRAQSNQIGRRRGIQYITSMKEVSKKKVQSDVHFKISMANGLVKIRRTSGEGTVRDSEKLTVSAAIKTVGVQHHWREENIMEGRFVEKVLIVRIP